MNNIFRKGFFKNKDKAREVGKTDEASKNDNKSGKLSKGDQQLVYMGLDPKEYRKKEGKSDHSKRPEVDKRESQESNESQEKDLTKQFRRTGGNTSLEHAKIICLGDIHTDDRHTKLNARLINVAAKDGDIVLLEAPAQEYTQQSLDETKLISKKVKVFGWDDYELAKETLEIAKKHVKLCKDINSRIDSGTLNEEEYKKLLREHEDFEGQRYSIGIVKRNNVLAQVINRMKEDFPNSKIFVLAGKNHFTEDASFQRYLETNQYIAFEPTVTLSGEARQEHMQQYYGE